MMPAAASFRVVGPAAERARRRTAPGRAPIRDDGEAVLVALEDAGGVAAIARALPDPNELAPGTLVVVPASLAGAGLGTRLIAAIGSLGGRARGASRADRCSALLARGYVGVGAGVDAATHADLAWAVAPERY